MVGIYKITNTINGKCYIGASNNIEERWKRHLRIYDNPNDKEFEKTLYRSFRKYGIENFEFSILEECPKDVLSIKEKEWIKQLKTDFNGYNETSGGEFGSKKGQNQGEKNGRSLLNETDIIQIRIDYSNGLKRDIAYEKVSNKITFGGFIRAWQGKTWAYIMPEVFTVENKDRQKRNTNIKGEKSPWAKLTEKQVKQIKIDKKNGLKKAKAYEKVKDVVSINTFSGVWSNKTWKDVQI